VGVIKDRGVGSEQRGGGRGQDAMLIQRAERYSDYINPMRNERNGDPNRQ